MTTKQRISTQPGSLEQAAAATGLGFDEVALLQGAHVQLLLAAARGDVDLHAMARLELANRGLDQAGDWVGFDRAYAAIGLTRRRRA